VKDSIQPSDGNTAETKAFEFDLQGNCWVSLTGGDLQVFFLNYDGHYNHSNSITYTKDDGLSSMGERYYRFVPDDSGNMTAFALRKGTTRLLKFTLQNASRRQQLETLQVSIGSILINHKRADWLFRGNDASHDNETVLLVLPYDENNITFNYNSSSLGNPSNISYKTMLKGFDKEWQETGTTSSSYTNLPAGKYTFLVQAANTNGGWGPVSKCPFVVRPPWYKTWWATGIWIILTVCIIFMVFFIRLKAVRTSMRMNHLEESSRFKTSLIGLIGHDMVTPLMYIAKVSLQLRNYNDKLSRQTTLESLGEINTTATQLHFFGTSIIHWINVQNADFNPVVEKFPASQLIKELVDFHHPLAVEKGNEINYELHGDLYVYQDPTLVRILIHNLLLNANKFTSKGKIIIAAHIESDWLTIHVKDNGRGMTQDTVDLLNKLQPVFSTLGTGKEKGWGLGYKVIMDMLKFTGGTLHVKSKVNEGTEVIVKMPCGDTLFSKRKPGWTKNAPEFPN
jgi:anti-sigma regulatory factor (Ser/Thr protein kinase)